MRLSQEECEILSFILKGRIRTKIIFTLIDNIKTPFDIAKEINVHLSSVCRAIKSLVNKDILLPLSFNKNGNNFYCLNDVKFNSNVNESFLKMTNLRNIHSQKY